MGRKDRICRQNVQTEVIDIPSGMAWVFDRDGIRRIVLAIEESWQAKHAVAVRAGGIAAKGDGKQFQGAFLLFEAEAVNSPKDLVLTERCGDDCVRRGDGI